MTTGWNAMAERDDSDFLRIPRKGGGHYLLRSSEAGAALSVHHRVLIETARSDAPDFAPASLIRRFTPDASASVAELCRAGMWEPADGGYRILDAGSVENATRLAEMEPEMRAICETEGHMPSYGWGAVFSLDGFSAMCLKCRKTLGPDDPIT
jgi:hypothetical protein